ncbi:MAG: hypothetical protein KDE14_12350, partial [Rhodobacteraceae bacterium]|nr:hypothetical protein [Paracoccaceae bacterium]
MALGHAFRIGFGTALFAVLVASAHGHAQTSAVNKAGWVDKFRQLDETWPTANTYRTASGAPGKDYWQQKVDYDIKVALNDDKQSIAGSETITYKNNSPD